MDIQHITEALAAREPIRLTDGADRTAAVALVIRADVDAEILLIRRATSSRDPWSGHMAFPGGRRDPGDADLLAAARRETLEEVGLTLDPTALVGQLDDLEAISRGHRTGLVIRPFVFAFSGDPPLTPNYEVAEALWAKLEPMRSGAVDTTRPWSGGGHTLQMPAYDVEGRIVWGLTYRMLRQLFAIVPRPGDGERRGKDSS